MRVVAFLRAVRHLADRRRSFAVMVGLLAALAASAGTVAHADPLTTASSTPIKPIPGEQMLVESDQILYDYDRNTVAAVGNVKIYYGGYTLEAEKVTYLKNTKRLIATGRVKLVDPSGIATYSDQIDLTDDFSDGFAQSLRVETPEKTYFAAERADRSNGEKTTFTRGVYTACEPCREHPERPPFWQVKAAKIVIDHKEKMIYFTDASLEFLGMPIAWLPYFSTPDSSVKRKSGFLAPSLGHSDELGLYLSTPYFFALAPNYDLTVTPTYYSRQGALGDAQWRHRLSNGLYTIEVAAIDQQDPGAFLRFDNKGNIKSGGYADREWRGGLRTTGEFNISSTWSYGWDVTLLSDRTFSRHYDVLNTGNSEAISSAHLTGLNDRNYFDMRAYHFEVLTDNPQDPRFDQGRQADVAPVIDHQYFFNQPVLGGELSVKSNLTALTREKDDPILDADGNATGYFRGFSGNYVRASSELDWQKQIIGPLGQVFTPFASVRGDAFGMDPTSAAGASQLPDDAATRLMPAVGVEWSWPILATAPGSTHIFEPIAQLIVRPDETMIGELPNNDAQSLVFDDSTLFDRDKFSGYDRVEGGTRLNAGIHYIGTFDSGFTLDGLFGQSYQLAGLNSFAVPDASNIAVDSGLQTDTSDYVGRLSLDTGVGPRFTARGRFDQGDFSLQRGELEATNAFGPITASAAYLYLRNFPNDPSIDSPTSVLRSAASVNFVENWRLYGAVAYDITNNALASDSVGLAYDNSCVTFALAYSETREDYSDIEPSRKISFLLSLRTLADAKFSTNLSGLQN